jgi:hypothetical protein
MTIIRVCLGCDYQHSPKLSVGIVIDSVGIFLLETFVSLIYRGNSGKHEHFRTSRQFSVEHHDVYVWSRQVKGKQVCLVCGRAEQCYRHFFF